MEEAEADDDDEDEDDSDDNEEDADIDVVAAVAAVVELITVGAAPVACAGVIDGKRRTICGENVLLSQTISSSTLEVAAVVCCCCGSSVILGNVNFFVKVLAGGTRPTMCGDERRPSRRAEFALRREKG